MRSGRTLGSRRLWMGTRLAGDPASLGKLTGDFWNWAIFMYHTVWSIKRYNSNTNEYTHSWYLTNASCSLSAQPPHLGPLNLSEASPPSPLLAGQGAPPWQDPGLAGGTLCLSCLWVSRPSPHPVFAWWAECSSTRLRRGT